MKNKQVFAPLLRLIAWVKGGQLVWLKDFQGEIYLTIAYKSPFVEDQVYGHIYPYTCVGNWTGTPDGKVIHSYVKEWVGI